MCERFVFTRGLRLQTTLAVLGETSSFEIRVSGQNLRSVTSRPKTGGDEMPPHEACVFRCNLLIASLIAMSTQPLLIIRTFKAEGVYVPGFRGGRGRLPRVSHLVTSLWS